MGSARPRRAPKPGLGLHLAVFELHIDLDGFISDIAKTTTLKDLKPSYIEDRTTQGLDACGRVEGGLWR